VLRINRGAVSVDQSAALLCVFFGEQFADRHVRLFGVRNIPA
jgi:hypothetical protein